MSFQNSSAQKLAEKRHMLPKIVLIALLLVAVGGAVAYGLNHETNKPTPKHNTVASTTPSHKTSATTGKTVPAPSPVQNYCAGNSLSQLILVSISKQRLWACSASTPLYDSAVVTGMEQYPADLTPLGTYHIYAKQTDLDLKGCDSTGCWDDPVSYWMPWLDNQYGQYGFHDATWRKPSEFGNVNIYAPETAAVVGSHGCVELPLATAKWLYNWSSVGTTVTVES